MKIKHHDIVIPPENPFVNCKLGREKYARVLSNIVFTYADGFVLAITNEWGAGKTTFVKMWQQQLKNEGFQTIYFNAWENDFDNNPLVALMSELETLTNPNNKEVFKSVVEKGAVLVKNIIPALVKSLIKKYVVGIEDIAVDAIDNATKASAEILEEEIKEYADKKKTIIEFRKELEKFIKQADNSKPLIFIVDELDRCRPNYSVEVLEQIKHFFSVSGVVFVLSIDKNHLASAVKGFYGSEQIDSNEYLRRFIDMEYSIPSPKPKVFTEYLYDYYQFSDLFSHSNGTYNSSKDGITLLEAAHLLFATTKTTLRQQERVFAITRLILCSFENKLYTFPSLLIILVYLKTIQNEKYQKIENNDFSLQELSDLFYSIMHKGNETPKELKLLNTEAQLLWFYNNNRDIKNKEILVTSEELNKCQSPIKSKFENENDNLTLALWLDHIKKNNLYNDLKLNYLTNKINLMDSIST
jgi:nucleoside-triphosphatase THEP1